MTGVRQEFLFQRKKFFAHDPFCNVTEFLDVVGKLVSILRLYVGIQIMLLKYGG
jgi:hypothetical protein